MEPFTTTTAVLFIVVMLMGLLVPLALEQPSCLHCGGRRWHGRNCPERDR